MLPDELYTIHCYKTSRRVGGRTNGNENECQTRKTTPRNVTRRPETWKGTKTRRNTRRKTSRDEMISLKRVGATHRRPARRLFSIDFFSLFALIWVPFWNTFRDFCIPFSSIEFASIFQAFLIDFWYPWSCKKTIFNVIPFTKNQKSQVPKFRRFVIDFGHRFGIILGAFSY